MLVLLVAGGAWPLDSAWSEIAVPAQGVRIQEPVEPVVTRAAFAQQLVQALGLPTQYVSEFPFFVDLPRSHPAYVPVEVLRERGFVNGFPNGEFRPDEPVSRLDAWLTVSGALRGIVMDAASANQLLEPFEDREEVPSAARIPLARLIQEDLIEGEDQETELAPSDIVSKPARLNLERRVTPEEVVDLMDGLRRKTAEPTRLASRTNDMHLPILPAGLTLSFSPTQAIFRDKLSAGETFYFLTNQEVAMTPESAASLYPGIPAEQVPTILLPRGTRLRARVVEADVQGGRRIWTFRLNQAQTPDNRYFRMKALLTLSFEPKDPNAFVVPGQVFTVQTDVFTTPGGQGTGSASPVSPPVMKTP
jgi:hypothetical protein